MVSKHNLFCLIIISSLIVLSSAQYQDQNLFRIESAPVTLDSPIVDVLWCGVTDQGKEKETEMYLFDINGIQNQKKSKLVFLQTHKGTIYRSDDEGFTWKSMQNTLSDLRDKLMQQLQDPQIKKIEEQSYIVKMQNSVADSQVIYFKGIQGISYYTLDCGQTFKAFKHDKNIHEFKLSEQQPGWLLGAAKNQCKEDKCYESYNLHFSNNYGQTWEVILEQIYEYSWGNFGGLVVKNAIPDGRIIVTLAKPRQYNSDRQVVYSDDFFKSRTVLSYNGHKFFIKMPNIYVLEYNTEAQTDKNNQSQYLLKQSSATAPIYNLKEIKIQIQRIKDHAFTILDSREHTIFININHYGSYAQFGNLYVSDLSGGEFSLSLLHNVRDSTGICDFERVLSLEGVYIANHIENEEADLILAEADQLSQSEGDQIAKLKNKVVKVKKTVISYDRGSTWHYLKPPQKDSLGKPISCSGECSLHLKGFTDDTANPIYSAYQAVGLIVAVGNTGLSVSSRPEEINTYFSRDGGHTWVELKKGSHIYEFGDHGGLIILAKDKEMTNYIEYTWDEGLTWEKYKFSEQKIIVTNIVTEPSNMDQIFLLYGQTKGSWDGIVYNLNFNNLHQQTCAGSWDGTPENSDYEEWTPVWSDKNNCMFGQLFKYVRRKQTSKCFNPDNVVQKIFYEVCNCTEDDYTCMSGFERNLKGLCVPMNQEVEERFKKQQLPPDDCQDTYKVPTGYKKIAGDFCVDGLNLVEKVLSCKEQREIVQQQTQQIHENFEQSQQLGEQINRDASSDGSQNTDQQKSSSERQYTPTIVEKSSKNSNSQSTSKFSQQQSSSTSQPQQESGGFFKKLLLVALIAALCYYFRENLKEQLANIMGKFSSLQQQQSGHSQQGYQRPYQSKDYEDANKLGGGSGLLDDDDEN